VGSGYERELAGEKNVEIRGLRPLIGLVSPGLNALERSLRGCALMGLKP